MANAKYTIHTYALNALLKEAILEEENLDVETKYSKVNGRKELRFTFIRDGKKGFLICFFPEGKVSFMIQGAEELKPLCEKVKQYIIENGTVGLPIDRKLTTIKDVSRENFDTYISFFEQSEDVEVTYENIKDANIEDRVSLTDKYNGHVYITYYNNGTVFIQGAITGFYLTVLNDSICLLSPADSNITRDFLAIQPDSNVLFNENISTYIPNFHLISNPVIESLILTTFRLVNSGINLPDCGAITFGIFKAVEAVLLKRVLISIPTATNLRMFHYDETTGIVTNSSHAFDGNPMLNDALKEGYKFYKLQRIPSFHVDASIITSRILDRDTAIGLVYEAIDRINVICNNW